MIRDQPPMSMPALIGCEAGAVSMPRDLAIAPVTAERAPVPPLSVDTEAGMRRAAARGAAMLLHAGAIALLLAHPPAEEQRAAQPAMPVELVSAAALERAAPPQPVRPPPPAIGPRVSGGDLDRAPGQASDAKTQPHPNPTATPEPPVADAAVAEQTPVVAGAAPPADVPAPNSVAAVPVPPPEAKDATAELAPALQSRIEHPAPSPPSGRSAALSSPPPSDQTRTEHLRPGQSGGDRYLNTVRRDILRNRAYPPAARSLGLAGTAEYSMLLDRKGRLLRLRLLRSSGADILDKAGMAAIERSAPFQPLPPDIIGDKVEVVVAVHLAP